MAEMNEQEMFQRTWYLPDQWWATDIPNDLTTWRTSINCKNASKWTVSGNWRNFTHLFLVDRPITFGHSQLVMPIPPSLELTEENVSFELTSVIIKCAIKVFENAFKEEKKEDLHTKPQFHDLAVRTCSFGRYIKTLIMRVSATENQTKKYKVHLLPYFESHAALCQERYCAIHNKSPDEKGGLIGWLGERETEVDRWEAGNFELTKIARDTWKLPEIANNLRKIWLKG